jgi:putative PIN family toxin of toxin-antitoxin system
MPGIVVDTSVFISALRSKRGASYRLLELLIDAHWVLNMSVALALEYEMVGKREANKLGIPGSAVDDIVDTLCGISRHHAVRFRLRPEIPDPNDEFVLDLAFVSRSDFIVTHNVRHFRAAERFGIAVVTPGEFLGTMGIKP